MKLTFAVLSLVSSTLVTVSALLTGLDVSGYQPVVDWNAVKAKGASFAYIKATEGTGYINPYFASQYNGAYAVGLIRGAYHFAQPSFTTGAAQAIYFVAHGGGWSPDGKTLPGAVDLEYNPAPGGDTCYGLTQTAMVSWIKDFTDTYHSITTRYPVIYTTTDWWTRCTGNSAAFAATSPLWLASYSTAAGLLPNGWPFYSFWQYASSGVFPGDQDYWNGDAAGLSRMATGK
ncbi:putative N,O-diacetyl muramidase [Umbelopsis sp. PMI_123]|nr:putative N,O-diacetyl muramidase [Umbelopsis sp. PMI_123]